VVVTQVALQEPAHKQVLAQPLTTVIHLELQVLVLAEVVVAVQVRLVQMEAVVLECRAVRAVQV
jgi:hypothetical protein